MHTLAVAPGNGGGHGYVPQCIESREWSILLVVNALCWGDEIIQLQRQVLTVLVQAASAVLLGATIYAAYHEGTVPVSYSESVVTCFLSIVMMVTTLVGVYRAYLWSCGVPKDWATLVCDACQAGLT